MYGSTHKPAVLERFAVVLSAVIYRSGSSSARLDERLKYDGCDIARRGSTQHNRRSDVLIFVRCPAGG